MSIESLSIEEIEKEIMRRKAAKAQEVRKELEAARRRVEELEAQLESLQGMPRRPAAPSLSRVTAGVRAEQVLTVLDGQGPLTSQEIAERLGCPAGEVRPALQALCAEGQIVKHGAARWTKYALSEH